MADPAEPGFRDLIRAEYKLLLIVFALNGISYVPMLTLPWFVAALSSQMHLSATRAGLAGSLLIGTVALVAGLAALRITPRTARAVGIVGGIVALAALGSMLLYPTSRILPLLLANGVGCGMTCAGANALMVTSRDPVRLNGSMWGLSVLWQIVIWWVAPLAAARASLDGLLLVQVLATALLLAITVSQRWRGSEADRAEETGPATPRHRLDLAAALAICAIAFWARDSMSWSLVDHRASLLGVDLELLQLTLVGTSLIGFGGSVLAAGIGLRFGLTTSVVATQLIALAVLGAMAGASGEAFYLAALLFWSGASMFAWPYVVALAVEADPSGRIAALCGGLLFAASAVGPLISGLLSDRWPDGLLPVVLGLGVIATTGSAYAARRLSGRAIEPTRTIDLG